MENEWKVTLCREPFLRNTTWQHKDKPSAMIRAYNLQMIHNCTVSVINASKRIYVHAAAYYARKG
jgi:hypothetical protein